MGRHRKEFQRPDSPSHNTGKNYVNGFDRGGASPVTDWISFTSAEPSSAFSGKAELSEDGNGVILQVAFVNVGSSAFV